MTDLLRIALALVHAGVAAVWLGSMAYSLIVVQPRAERFLADQPRYEEFAATLAAGARWKVLGMIAALALSGAGLVWLAGTRPSWWTALVIGKSALLLIAFGQFWQVSWRLWPRRVFALPDELPALRRRFHLAALALSATVAIAFALGVLAAHG